MYTYAYVLMYLRVHTTHYSVHTLHEIIGPMYV